MGISPNKKRKASPKKKSALDARDTGAANMTDSIGIEPDTARMRTTATSSASTGVSSEEKHQLIAKAAYFRAERRSFVPGYELEDWLDAEAEIEKILSKIGIDNPASSS